LISFSFFEKQNSPFSFTIQMTPPRFLLSCTLLFWGWQSNLLIFAVPMAMILEAARWVNWRWALSDKDFNRVTDLTSLLLLIVTIYLINQQSIHGLMTLLNWLPMLLFLLVAAQSYSTEGSVKLSSLFLSLRRYDAQERLYGQANQRINLSYPYLMLCLLSTSAANQNSFWFFMGMCFLIAWGIWKNRPKRYSVIVFGLLLTTAAALGYLTQFNLYRLQTQMEDLILDWIQELFMADTDPYRQNTAIGDIGRLKQSDKIILRVESAAPLLLREASYNIYFKTTWFAKETGFTEVLSNGEMTWTLTSDFSPISKTPFQKPKTMQTDFEKVQVSAFLRQGNGMLALPHGTYQISKLFLPTLQRNDFGAVKVENGPGLIHYTAHFAQQTPLDKLPSHYDLSLPTEEKNLLIELSNQLQLPNQTPQQVLNTLTTFFEQNFQYSLTLTAPAYQKKSEPTPLAHFIKNSRAGHCEYFATATVLLLRAAGIPSRYASGYAVEEWSDLESKYVVRQRHAHAWALAYMNGRWVELDTTPATWFTTEASMAAWWQPIYDIGSFLSYQFSKWRWRETDDRSSNDWLLWLILPLGLILIWRLYSREKVSRSDKSALIATNTVVIGADSAFFEIVQRLNAAGYIRQSGETLTAFLKRINAEQMSEPNIQTLLRLHQRYRFGSARLSGAEKTELTTSVKKWLDSVKIF
jgi:transglutaminase-like putative cysteine protease